MDSGNSGSLQSSSGGDDEFDSRCGGGGADSSPLSALFRQPVSAPSSAPGFGGGGSLYGLQDLATPPLSHWSSTPLPGAGGAGAASSTAPRPSRASGDQAAAPVHQAAPPRGSRKRTRASRRAPTTVLTTDTSNFRAMVQEFTGVPAPPFAASARFDHLFPSRSAAAGLSPYLLRPFAHKLQQASPYPPFLTTTSSSPPVPAASIAVASSAAPAGTAAAASGDGYHQLASAPPPGVLGMRDHHNSNGSYLSFQQSSMVGMAHGQLDGDARYAAHPMFDAQRLPDPAGFLDGIVTTEGTHLLHPRHRGDELSGVVGGCKATYSGSAPRATPLLDRTVESTSTGIPLTTTTTTPVTATAPVRTQQGVDSWICTSESIDTGKAGMITESQALLSLPWAMHVSPCCGSHGSSSHHGCPWQRIICCVAMIARYWWWPPARHPSIASLLLS